ncbi:MAG: 16S rRNA (cytosine(1402)-N(4))-methyltransferase RsmH [Anaerolineales bacterium]|jgi:16S rRNA (cytosine1402-N4)-methyltransferase|nr:16S rRNA (cytosine(1402)-N(4))-methyltransferase RsmH [Anaerolineales bacterium]
MQHVPVLFHEVLDTLALIPGGLYVDGTVGAGGHAQGILKAISPDGKLLGLDRDPAALEIAESRLAEFGNRVVLIHSSYSDLKLHLNNLNWKSVDGILLDLGLSSMQLDNPERGFSFRKSGPLDMRFDTSQPFSAADLVNESSKDDLADLIFRYGEERYSRKIADAIIANRPLEDTQELADIIESAIRNKPSRIHPATRTFQALRIAVNQELKALEAFLPTALDALNPGGRLAVIAFHSLEDRIVKQFFRKESKDCICPPEIPQCVCEHKKQLKEINRRPIRPEDKEILDNPRSRSAKLRVAEKI